MNGFDPYFSSLRPPLLGEVELAQRRGRGKTWKRRRRGRPAPPPRPVPMPPARPVPEMAPAPEIPSWQQAVEARTAAAAQEQQLLERQRVLQQQPVDTSWTQAVQAQYPAGQPPVTPQRPTLQMAGRRQHLGQQGSATEANMDEVVFAMGLCRLVRDYVEAGQLPKEERLAIRAVQLRNFALSAWKSGYEIRNLRIHLEYYCPEWAANWRPFLDALEKHQPKASSPWPLIGIVAVTGIAVGLTV